MLPLSKDIDGGRLSGNLSAVLPWEVVACVRPENRASCRVARRKAAKPRNISQSAAVQSEVVKVPSAPVRQEKRAQTQTCGSGYLPVGGGLPRERVGGGQKFSMSLETQGDQTFGWDIPGFLPGYPGGALFEQKRLCSISGPYPVQLPN